MLLLLREQGDSIHVGKVVWFVSWACFFYVNKDVSKISLTFLKLKLNQEKD